MNHSKKLTPLRPVVEFLDARELLSASPAAIVMPTLVQVTPILNPATPKPLLTSSAVKASPVAFDATYTVSVITIQNKTSNPVNFQLQWTGTAWKSYSLKPGETRLYLPSPARIRRL